MKKLSVMFALLIFASFVAFGQTVQITGTVTSSEDGGSLPGVQVVVKGTTIGVITGVNGNFTIAAPANATTLVFSYVGMKKQEVQIEGRTTVNVVMELDLLKVDEVVVTAIGIKRETKALGYSMQAVSSEDLTKGANQDVINSLSGKVAGVQITSTSGAAGASAYIQIRGASSLTRSNQPLWVVDGVPVYSGGGGMGVSGWNQSSRTVDINPEDIESMSVLKGGAATALYGLAAANGVILITTKKGASGRKATVEFSHSTTLKTISQMPERQTLYAQGSRNAWAGPHTGSSTSWGPRIDTMRYDGLPYKWDPFGQLVGMSSPTATSVRAQYYDPYEYFQTGVQVNNFLGMSGGNEDANFYMSIGQSTEKGVNPGNDFDKITFKISGEAKLHEKFKVQGSMNYANSKGKRIRGGSDVSGVMLGLLRTATTFDNSAGYMFPDGTQRNYRGGGGYDNPYWITHNVNAVDKTNRMYGNIGFTWDPTPWMNVTYRLGTDWYTQAWKTTYAKNSRGYTEGFDGEDAYFDHLINSDLFT